MNIYRIAIMAKELILGGSGGLISKIPLSVSIPFHIDSLNQTSLQGLRFIHPDQKLLYLFTLKCVLLKVNQSESEFILVCVHAPYRLLFRWGLVVGQADLKTEHLEFPWNSLLITLLCRHDEQTFWHPKSKGLLLQRSLCSTAPPKQVLPLCCLSV